MSREITKIVIKGAASGLITTDQYYKDTLTIQNTGISYVYKPYIESKTNPKREWSYKTNCETFASSFSNIVKEVMYLSKKTVWPIDDLTPLQITCFSGKDRINKFDFYACELPDSLLNVINMIVPKMERFPKSLKG